MEACLKKRVNTQGGTNATGRALMREKGGTHKEKRQDPLKDPANKGESLKIEKNTTKTKRTH